MKIKPLYRFLIWLLLILAVVISFLAYYFQHNQKDLFLAILQSSLKHNISASDVDYDFPFGFSLDDFQIDGVIQAKKLTAQLDPRSFKEKHVILSQIIVHMPIITWNNNIMHPDSNTAVVASADTAPEVTAVSITRKKTKILINNLKIRTGQFHFVDESASRVLSFKLTDLQLKTDAISFPLTPLTTTFQFTAKLVKEGTPLSGSTVKGDGWMNLVNKDLEANFLVVEANGNVGLSARAVAKNNDMHVEGKIKAKNLFNKGSTPTLEEALDNMLFKTLSNIGLEIGIDFTFDTKLDSMRIEELQFKGSASTTNTVAP